MLRALVVLALLSACVSVLKPGPANTTKSAATERTWWQLCWPDQELTAPDYPDEEWPHKPACAHPQPITWPGRTVTLTLDESAQRYRKSIYLAILQWNLWAGRPVFILSKNGRVRIYVDDAGGIWSSGRAEHYRYRRQLYANVILAGKLGHSYPIVLHELGHVLGFGHDADVVDSVMHPYAPTILITTKDLEALRERYGPKAR